MRAVSFWLRDLELERYGVVFAAAGHVTLHALTQLTDGAIEKLIDHVGDRHKLQTGIREMKVCATFCFARNWKSFAPCVDVCIVGVRVLLFGQRVAVAGAGHGALLAAVRTARHSAGCVAVSDGEAARRYGHHVQGGTFFVFYAEFLSVLR